MLSEKVIIMPSYAEGNQLKESAVQDGYFLLNMKIETLIGIAKNRCKMNILKNKYTFIDNSIVSFYIYEILRKLKHKNQLKYFNKLEIYPGFVKSIYNSIYELRMAGYTSHNLRDECFVNVDKAMDMKNIMMEYEQLLLNKMFIDDYKLYQLAMAEDNKTKDKVTYIVPNNLRLTDIETKFFDFLTKGNIQNIESMIMPVDNKNPLNYLYDIENLPNELTDMNIEFVSALGRSNESKEVIRNIKSNKLVFDNVLVLYTIREPYSQYFYLLSQKYDLPITFADGISVKNTLPGQLYFSLINLIKDNYNIADFISMLNGGLFSFEEEAPSLKKLIELLNESKIVRGKEQYCQNLERLIEVTSRKSDTSNSLNKLDNLVWLSNFSNELLGDLSLLNDEGMTDLAEFAKGIYVVINKYSKTNSQMDIEAKKNILEKLGLVIEHSKSLVIIEDGILQLTESIEELRVCVSGPKPGYIHISSYHKGAWIRRENTFIIGLDAPSFPGQALEDPILLDIERQKLGNGIFLKKDEVNEKLKNMFKLLTYIKGKIYMSYNSYDTLENKELSPSSLLLQAYRLHKKDATLDYEKLNEHFNGVAGFLVDDENKMLDENDWWLNKQIYENALASDEQFCALYNNICKGISALNKRESDIFTEYDGSVEFDFNETGILRNGRLILSSSQLEALASCPYKFFLKYILKVKQPENSEFSSTKWLDPAARGTLLHKVFEGFYQELKIRNERPSITNHEGLIREIAIDELKKISEVLESPSALIFELEANEIMDSCGIFLAYEAENLGDYLPSYLELSFGLGDINNNLGEIPEVEVKLPSGKTIYIRGKIDRVDKLSADDYAIIDYKSGSTYGYSDNEYFRKGQNLQHALYAIALESILKDKEVSGNPKVSKAVYLFPTIKGEGQTIVRDRDKRDDVYNVLEKLLNVLEEGSFISTDMDNDCNYCEFKSICENVSSRETIKKMRDNSLDNGVESLRGLGIYE